MPEPTRAPAYETNLPRWDSLPVDPKGNELTTLGLFTSRPQQVELDYEAPEASVRVGESLLRCTEPLSVFAVSVQVIGTVVLAAGPVY